MRFLSALMSTSWSKIEVFSKRMSPSMRTLSIRSFRRLMLRRSVDLPQPDGPMNAVILRSGILSEMS